MRQGALADVPAGAVDALQQRLQPFPEDRVIVRTAQPTLGPELHVLDAARRAGQPGQVVGLLAQVLADQGLQDGRQVQVLLLEELLVLGTAWHTDAVPSSGC